jgi:hypothetical protein
MKRVMGFLTAVFLMGSFLMPIGVTAGVAGQYKDQAFEDVGSIDGSMTVNNYGRAQTFKPTANKIVAVNLYLKDMTPDKNLSVTIKKESDGTVVAPAEASVPFTGQIKDGWVTIAYESPFISVTPETEYGIYATITGDTQTKWSWSNNNPYARGQAKGFVDDDFLFSVWGVLETTTTVETQTTAVVDESLKSPILVTVEKQKHVVDLTEKKELILASRDEIVLKGTSFKGASVVIFVEDKGYTASVTPDGSWEYPIDAYKLKEGTYTIQGQAIKDIKGSEKAELLKVKVLGVKTDTTVADKSLFAGWDIFYVLIPIGILLLVLLLLAIIARRHHYEKTGWEPEEKEEKKEENTEEESSEKPKKATKKK